jgi:uncharacterized protein HemY
MKQKYMTDKPTKESKAQISAFIAAAKAAQVDEDEARWERRLKKVAKPPAKPKKA